MRSLFLKILLWFGLAMILVNVASFATGVIIERQSQGPRANPIAPVFGVYAATAVEILERDGPAALASFLERVERASAIRAVLLDARGREVTGRAVPTGAVELAERVSESEPFVSDAPRPPSHILPSSLPLAAQLVRSPRDGALYTLIGELPRRDFPHPPPRLGEPGSFFFGLRMLTHNLLPVLLVGGLFCYWLARHLTTPIVKLRDTTHELANGDLAARVSPSLARRHDELGYLGREFNLMAGRIESLVTAQQRLLGDISHELRSPLARLGVALELVRRRAAPTLSPGLDRIGREAESINEMIGQLLMLSRIESGTGGRARVPLDLCQLVREIAADADFEAQGHHRRVRVADCEACPTIGVIELLRSAIENVVRNAMRYTAEGTEVEISLRCAASDGLRVAVISVRDHGAGVPEAAVAEIFRPFYRVEEARDRQTGGTGLGLAIAARAVRLHNGSITASNATDGGLIVELKLPLTADADAQPEADPTSVS